jgi:hypothetical protein
VRSEVGWLRFNRSMVELPPDPILIRELKLLERHPSNLGKEVVTHPRGVHDDRANVVAGVIRTLTDHLGFDVTWSWVDGPDRDETNQTKAQAESDANFRWRLGNYLRSISGGSYGWR